MEKKLINFKGADMKKFENFIGEPVIMAEDNIDTDKIIPKQFLTTTTKKGLGKFVFYEKRYDTKGDIIKDYFVNNFMDNKNNLVLISGKNFGCGSSREHAPWALMDFGFRVVMAESFADIFYSNSFKNGLLLIRFSKNQIEEIVKTIETKGCKIFVDLKKQKIILKDNKNIEIKAYDFAIDEFKKYCLMNGLEEIGFILDEEKKTGMITNFETRQKQEQSWLYFDYSTFPSNRQDLFSSVGDGDAGRM